MNRREFLRLTGLVTLPVAVPLLSSCTDKKGGTSGSPSPSTAATTGGVEGSLQSIVDALPLRAELHNAQPETLLGSGRVAFGLTSSAGPLLGANLTLYAGQDVDEPPVITARASWVQGEMAPRGLYVADLKLPAPGEWLIGMKAQTKDGKAYGGGARLKVTDASPVPVPGQPAISLATPTTADPAGADPLCSNSPVCSMHAISLDKALTNGKPTVYTIAAPAYCTSETCGPVVRLVDAIAKKTGDRANFVHLEVYNKGAQGTPTFVPQAIAWKLDKVGEPFTFFIDAKGVVADRLPGAFGEQELADRVAKLLR